MAKKKSSERTFKFLIYLVVVVLVNVAAVTLFFRWDLTANKVYSLSKASKQVVDTLSEPLTIKVFFTQNLPAPHNNTERYLRDLLEEYAIYGNRYFNYAFYDVSPTEGGDVTSKADRNQELAKSYGINPVQIQVVEKDEVKFQKAYMGLVLIHGDMIERIPTITSTDGLEYRLTTAIKKLNNKVSALLRLQGKIQVKLFMSSSLKSIASQLRIDNLGEVPAKLQSIVDQLNQKTYGKLQFTYLDPSEKPDLEKEAEKYHVMKLTWPALEDGSIPAGQGFIGLIMEYQDKVVDVPLLHVIRLPLIGTQYQLAELDKMEQTLSDNLENLISINQDLGYLADNGTINLFGGSPMSPGGQQGLDIFQNLVSRNYSIKEVHLKKGSIPDDIDCLVIARPTEPFNDYELFQIDQFLMQGKNLALFIDAFNEVMPQNQQMMASRQGPQYVPIDTGLGKLLEHYGIRIQKAYVLDENCYKQRVPAQFGGGERPIYFAPLIKNRFINHDLRIMKNIKGLVAFQVSPLELVQDQIKKNGVNAIKLISSSNRSWDMRGRINFNPMFIQPPKSDDAMKSQPLAYLLEGEFKSYFAGKSLPEKPVPEKTEEAKTTNKKTDDQGSAAAVQESKTQSQEPKKDTELAKIKSEDVFLKKGKPGKIFLMASSNIIQDNLLDEEGRGPNSLFVMNMIDYLNNNTDIAVMRSKQQRFNPLNETGPTVKTAIKSINIVGLPIVVILFGLLVWLRRAARKRRIQTIFQQ